MNRWKWDGENEHSNNNKKSKKKRKKTWTELQKENVREVSKKKWQKKRRVQKDP